MRISGWTGSAGLSAAVLLAVPTAAAEPQFPDLGHYPPVDAAGYTIPVPTDGPYPGAVTGVRFNTPGGQSCYIMTNTRGMWATAGCAGPMPGVSHTAVSAGTTAAGEFLDNDPGTAQNKLLPAGHKIEYTRDAYSGTCAVDEAMTACVVTTSAGSETSEPRHGFVLGPRESSTF